MDHRLFIDDLREGGRLGCGQAPKVQRRHFAFPPPAVKRVLPPEGQPGGGFFVPVANRDPYKKLPDGAGLQLPNAALNTPFERRLSGDERFALRFCAARCGAVRPPAPAGLPRRFPGDKVRDNHGFWVAAPDR